LKQLIRDTIVVTDYLKRRFGKEKIFLLGHSWGSTLGSLVVQERPFDYMAYVGVGQVVSQSSLNPELLTYLAAICPLLTFQGAGRTA
jgi:pimeloyl-ACP methyl ester carboxylesterase